MPVVFSPSADFDLTPEVASLQLDPRTPASALPSVPLAHLGRRWLAAGTVLAQLDRRQRMEEEETSVLQTPRAGRAVVALAGAPTEAGAVVYWKH